MTARHASMKMLCVTQVSFFAVSWSVPASGAITVTFEQIARTGDPVPGRETLPVVFNGRAFQRFGPGVFSRPAINDAGQVLFMARSTVATNFNQLSTIGLYLKSPGMPLELIFDQSDKERSHCRVVERLAIGYLKRWRSGSRFTKA